MRVQSSKAIRKKNCHEKWGGPPTTCCQAIHSNLLPFTFPSVGLEVVKHSFQQQEFDKAARGGLGSYEARVMALELE